MRTLLIALAVAGIGASLALAAPPGLTTKVKFKDDSGAELFSLKPEPDGAKLVDSAGAELARYKVDGETMKIKDRGEKILGYVVGVGGTFKLEDPTRKTVLYVFRKQEDGHWTLKDPQGTLIRKLKPREYGFEIEDGKKTSLFKVKVKDGKTSLRDASDKTKFATKDAIHPLAVACLGLDAIASLPLRAGLLVRVAQAGTP